MRLQTFQNHALLRRLALEAAVKLYAGWPLPADCGLAFGDQQNVIERLRQTVDKLTREEEKRREAEEPFGN